MKTALFNGCSFVWGDELQDPYSSRFSKLISDELKLNEVNLSIRGASNDRIFRTTMDHLESNPSPEILIISWSSIDRFEYIDLAEQDVHDHYYLQCSPSRINQREFRIKRHSIERFMLDIQNDYKRSIDTINYMSSIQKVCELSSIKLLQFQFAHRHRNTIHDITNSIPKNEREHAFLEYYDQKLSYLMPYSTYGLLDMNDLLTMSIHINDVEVGKNYYGHPLEKSQVMFKDMMIKELERHYDFRI